MISAEQWLKLQYTDMDGNEIAVHGENCTFLIRHSGQNERDMYEVKDMSLKSNQRVIEKAGIQDGKEILSIGITGQGNGAYMVDKDGVPTWPGILSSDAALRITSRNGSPMAHLILYFHRSGTNSGQDRQARSLPGLRIMNQKFSTKQLTSVASKIISVTY